MNGSYVSVRVKIAGFENLAHLIAALPLPFRPQYFSRGGRVRNKAECLIEDEARFRDFVAERVRQVSGFDLIGERIRYGLFVGETRTAEHQSTHIGCSATLAGARWSSSDLLALLKLLCRAQGVERAEACRRDEWEYRHLCLKQFADYSVQRTLGVDMSAALPGLYWWTVFSQELATRHRLDVADVQAFAKSAERWLDGDERVLHAFRLYDAPEDWVAAKGDVTAFLETRSSFFSLARLAPAIDSATSRDAFEIATRQYVAGAKPWQSH
jgi:hypothetical protein